MQQTIQKMKEMRLHQMSTIHHQRATDHQHQDYSVDEYVDLLIDQEWEDRQTRKMQRLIKSAKFKIQATIGQIDYKSARGLERDLISRLSSLNFIRHKQNVILTGPAGVGKSYIAQALGHQACFEGYKTLYQNTSRFLSILKYAKLEGSYLKHLKTIARSSLLILDDFGLQNLDKKERDILMDLVEDRHDRASIIIASQIPVSKWFDIIGEGTIADAILDRIVHSAHRIDLKGESLRKKKKLKL